MNLDKIKKQWNEYNEEFDSSDYMDIDTHTSMALRVGELIHEIEKQKEEIAVLQDRVEFLNCLEACGVDNWGGYSDAWEMHQEEEE